MRNETHKNKGDTTMIFLNQVQNFQNQVHSNAATIEVLQAQIEQLREENLRLETHLQALGTAEAAAQSAIEQMRIAIQLVNAIDPSQLEVLHTEVENLFQPVQEFRLLEASSDDDTDPDNDPDSTPPAPTTPTPVDDIIEHKATPRSPATATIDSLIEETATIDSLIEETATIDSLIEETVLADWSLLELGKLSAKEIRKIANQVGLQWRNAQGKIIDKDTLVERLTLLKTNGTVPTEFLKTA
jgi:FtsZ-binding cell division protein ZapB